MQIANDNQERMKWWWEELHGGGRSLMLGERRWSDYLPEVHTLGSFDNLRILRYSSSSCCHNVGVRILNLNAAQYICICVNSQPCNTSQVGVQCVEVLIMPLSVPLAQNTLKENETQTTRMKSLCSSRKEQQFARHWRNSNCCPRPTAIWVVGGA